MEENRELFMLAQIKLYKLFKSKGKYFFPTITSLDARKLFGRDPLLCFAVNSDINERIYFYFLSSHVSFISKEILFSSILMVPVDALITKDMTKCTKFHVTNHAELGAALEKIKEVL